MLKAALAWLVAAIVFLILEFTLSAYMLPFAIGCAAALLSVAFDASLFMQILIFVVVTVIAYLVLRPDKRKGDGDGDDPIDPGN